MLLPIKTDVSVRRTPVVNYTLIAVNVLIYFGVSQFLARSPNGAKLHDSFMLWAESPQWYQFLTSMFMHGSWWHLLGNMVFLWVFGNALECKLGHMVYLMFYIACGLAAGAGYVLFENMPVVGASGAIFGVTAGFIVLYPLSRVTVVYFLYFVGLLELSGMLVVGFFIALNLFYLIGGYESGVAYLAHLFGAGFGLVAALILLASGAVGRDQYDLLALLRRWRQRVSYANYMSDARNATRSQYGRVAQPVDELGRPMPQAASLNPAAEQIERLRVDVGQAIAAGNVAAAGRLYSELLAADPEQVLPARQQVDLGSYLMSDGQYQLAGQAYESLLAHYPGYESKEQIQLLLGLIFGRYLHDPAKARGYLESSMPRLRDQNQRDFARRELEHVNQQS